MPSRENSNIMKDDLKVWTNEKRGGLKVGAFNRSPFKLFTLRFSDISAGPILLEALNFSANPVSII
jgi:hypothetical protein